MYKCPWILGRAITQRKRESKNENPHPEGKRGGNFTCSETLFVVFGKWVLVITGRGFRSVNRRMEVAEMWVALLIDLLLIYLTFR